MLATVKDETLEARLSVFKAKALDTVLADTQAYVTSEKLSQTTGNVEAKALF